MRRVEIQSLRVLLMLITAVFAVHASAEIYKWIDADGKVHFGDKPKDPAVASGAQRVELRESYQPPVRTPQEQQDYDKEQRAIELRNQMHRREAEKADQAAELERNERKAALCASYQEKIDELETIEVKDGRRTLVYVEGEDGQAVSSERQREIIGELKAKKSAAGCP